VLPVLRHLARHAFAHKTVRDVARHGLDVLNARSPFTLEAFRVVELPPAPALVLHWHVRQREGAHAGSRPWHLLRTRSLIGADHADLMLCATELLLRHAPPTDFVSPRGSARYNRANNVMLNTMAASSLSWTVETR